MLPGQHPQNFFVDELQNSLEEQLNLGAIKSFRVVSNTNTEAIAQVALLEDQTVEVVLNGAGYQVQSKLLFSRSSTSESLDYTRRVSAWIALCAVRLRI